MTINAIIEKVNLYHPSDISASIKYRWIGQLDKKKYLYPEDGETELLIKAPHENIYELYLVAMIDFFECDLKAYEISAQKFQIEYEKLMSDLIVVNINTNTCVSCGETIPEGEMVCYNCKNK